MYVYPDSQAEETLHVVNDTSVYGLTGAVFSNDRLDKGIEIIELYI